MSKYGVISGPYFPAFEMNTGRYEVSLRIQSECGKIRTRNDSVFGHFSRSDIIKGCNQFEARKMHLNVSFYPTCEPLRKLVKLKMKIS